MTFEEYLQDKHAAQYQGLDDEMPDNFNEWLCDLDTDEWSKYAERWCISILEELRIKKVLGTETRIDLFKTYENKITEQIKGLREKKNTLIGMLSVKSAERN